eukprot:TRINITY_DN596_c0_g2_i2.p1 TRINITY_DN596_c0_g2~~TRINITY_DN596_c0_g2_i2.p1  ORF type:complete len:132 (+),score=41.09 TRINITY_DN596_c0_g2_i2:23-418(+)
MCIRDRVSTQSTGEEKKTNMGDDAAELARLMKHTQKGGSVFNTKPNNQAPSPRPLEVHVPEDDAERAKIEEERVARHAQRSINSATITPTQQSNDSNFHIFYDGLPASPGQPAQIYIDGTLLFDSGNLTET